MLRTFSPIAAVILVAAPAVNLAEEGKEKKITFEEHIKPIFREHCTACHSASDKSSDLALDTYGATLAGGSSGDVIAEGNTGGSRLYQLMTHAERPFMPPDQDPIPKEQIELVRIWIEQGMPENAGSKIKRVNNAAAAMIQNVAIGKPEGPPPMPERVLTEPVIETSRAAAIAAMAASPWSPLLAIGGQKQVALYHSQSGELLGIIPFPEGEPHSLVFTRDGQQLLIGGGRHSHSGCAVLVDISSGERIAKVGDELDTVLAADISPDKSKIAIAGPQKIVRILDSLSGETVFELKKHTDWIYALRYSPDGVLLASGDRSNGLILWEADTGNLYSQLNGHKGEVRSLDFRGDSNVLASGSLDGTIKLWDMYESKEIRSWNAHAGGVTSLAFTNSGMIASAGRDKKIKLWDGSGQLQKEFSGLPDAALEVAVAGDGSFIAGGDWSGRVSLWPTNKPDDAVFIAANPPSIARRLEIAKRDFVEVEQQFNTAKTQLDSAKHAADSALQELHEVEAGLQTTQQQITQKTALSNDLQAKVENADATIRELEKELADRRQARKEWQQSLQLARQEIVGLQQQQQSSQQSLASSQQAHQKLAEAAAQAEEAIKQLQSKYEFAQSTLRKAEADQAAMNKRAEELRASASATEQRVASLSAQLENSAQEQQGQETKLAEQRLQLEDLQQQLNKLQMQVEAVLEAQSRAQAMLTEKQKLNESLQQQLESAQQASMDAQEQLQLFEKAYGRTDDKY